MYALRLIWKWTIVPISSWFDVKVMLVFADSPLLMKILLSGKLILNGGTKGGFSTKSLSSGRGVIIIPNEIKNIRIEPKKIKSNIPFFSFGKSHPPQ